MAYGDNQYVDPSDLANLSRGGNVLSSMGYDPDEVRANPSLRAEVMQKVAGPMQVAQNTPPPQIPNPRSQNGNDLTPATPGGPRLLNRQQPTIPAPAQTPAQPPPDTLPKVSSASVSPSGTSAPSNAPDIANARQAVGNLLAPEPAEPDTSAQDAQIASHSIPLNPRDKLYREGRLGKIGRGFIAAAAGLGEGGVRGAIEGAAEPAKVGATPYGAPNSGYAIDEATRQAELKRAQDQKADIAARFKTTTDLRKQRDAASKDAGTVSADLAKLPNETTTANADMMRAQQGAVPKNEQEAISAAYEATDPAEAARYFKMAKDMHTATMQEKPPRQPGEQPSSELVQFEDWKAAFQRENHRAPTSREIQDYRNRSEKGIPTREGFQNLLRQRDAEYQTWQKSRDAEMKAAIGDSEKAELEAKYNGELDALQDRWNGRLADYDPEGQLSHAGSSDDVAPSAPAATQKAAPPSVGTIQKGYRYNGGDPSDPASWSKVNARGRNR